MQQRWEPLADHSKARTVSGQRRADIAAEAFELRAALEKINLTEEIPR